MSNQPPQSSALPSSSLIWDNHACPSLKRDDGFLSQLERYRQSGVSVVSLNIGYAERGWAEHLMNASNMRRSISLRHDAFRLVSTIADVHRCKLDGKLGIVFDIEGMYPVQYDLSMVQTFYELGVRWMLIAYNFNNDAGGGCLDVDCGLTALGRSIIDEMERVGMVLCLSHAGARTATEALEYSRNPVIFSHSNPLGDTIHPRNVPDDLIRGVARTGGVIGISGIGPFLGASSNLVASLLRQLRYVIDRVGPEHVGLGLDYVFDRSALDENVRKNPGLYPVGVTGSLQMIEPDKFGEIVDGLARDNLTEAQIRGVLGENWLRIAAAVWR